MKKMFIIHCSLFIVHYSLASSHAWRAATSHEWWRLNPSTSPKVTPPAPSSPKPSRATMLRRSCSGENLFLLRRFQESVLITTRRRLFSALRTGCVHLTARLVNNCRKYSAKRAVIKSHVWAHPLQPPNGASWDFIASCTISFFERLRTGDRGCTNRKTVAERVYAARSLALKNNRSTERTLNPKP